MFTSGVSVEKVILVYVSNLNSRMRYAHDNHSEHTNPTAPIGAIDTKSTCGNPERELLVTFFQGWPTGRLTKV